MWRAFHELAEGHLGQDDAEAHGLCVTTCHMHQRHSAGKVHVQSVEQVFKITGLAAWNFVKLSRRAAHSVRCLHTLIFDSWYAWLRVQYFIFGAKASVSRRSRLSPVWACSMRDLLHESLVGLKGIDKPVQVPPSSASSAPSSGQPLKLELAGPVLSLVPNSAQHRVTATGAASSSTSSMAAAASPITCSWLQYTCR